jgi:hypothetical protein
MQGPPLVLADASRAEQFLLVGRLRQLLDGYAPRKDGDGIVWGMKTVGSTGFAFTWLGPGWVFDPTAQERRAKDLRTRQARMTAADPQTQRKELDAVVARMRLGPTAERLLWLVHQQVLRLRTSVLQLPDLLLADAVWTGRGRPAHWRGELLAVLQGLTWLHLTEGPPEESGVLGAETAVLTHVADLRGTANDACRDGCAGQRGPKHHHYLVNVGRGFLGVLEEFAQAEDEDGVRSYAFPVGGRQSSSLRKAGKSGRLVTVYLPAKLGDRAACDGLTLTQRRLLQAAVRETTRATKENRTSVSEAEVLHGNVVPTTDGKGAFPCELLGPNGDYVGFNGNKLLKGRGYLIRSQGGWMARAGYSTDQLSNFLADLGVLSERLALIPVGVEPQNPSCLGLGQMTALAGSTHGMTVLQRLHLRLYAPADYLARWNDVFHWKEEGSPPSVADDPARDVTSAVRKKVISQRQLAEGMGVDPSLLNKVLRGKRPWPAGWLERATAWLASQQSELQRVSSPPPQEDRESTNPEVGGGSIQTRGRS